MKTLLALILFASPLLAQTTLPERNASLKQELQLSFQRGLSFLKGKQNADGSWGEAEPVAFTAMVLASHLMAPDRKPGEALTPALEKGYAFLMSNIKPDGGIYVKARANYNTALSLLALVLHPHPETHDKAILDARRYLVGRQMDLDEKGKADNPLDWRHRLWRREGQPCGPQQHALHARGSEVCRGLSR